MKNRLLNLPTSLILALILLIGFLLRLYGLSHGMSFHPDERHIVMVTERLSWKDLNPHFFAYGSFPFYCLWIIAETLGLVFPTLAQYDGLFIVGRSISVLFAITAGFLTYKIAFQVFKSKYIAFTAAAMLMFNSFHIQLSHFYAFDGVLTALNLATLLVIIKLADSQTKLASFLLAGILLGLSVATKISALSLLIPFSIAIGFRLYATRQWFSWRLFTYLVIFSLTTLACFTLAEPYAWLDWKTFVANNNEQISMVKGLWRPPYTVQYANTTPYIYHLEQIFKYTIGAPVAILGLLGILIVGISQIRRLNSAQIILLSWILPTFFVIGGYQVKFPRYLIPLYPIFFIFAAYALAEFTKKLLTIFPSRKLICLTPATLIIGFCLLRSVAFISIYGKEHTYTLASRWIYANIESGARFSEGHWDDTLPLQLPGLESSRYRFEGKDYELPLYEPDSPQKFILVTDRTAKSDYIIFPTQRLPGSLTRVPEEFEQTNNYLKLLYAGNLGFEMVQTVKVRPKFGPYEINDDLADESLSVYDHPKVTSFKNTEHLSADEIRLRILSAERYSPLPTREEILLKDFGSKSTKTEAQASSIACFIIWFITLQILALAVLPLLSYILPQFPDQAYGLSKTFGFFIFGFLSWYLPALGIAPASELYCTLVFLVILCTSYYFSAGLNYWKIFYKKNPTHIMAVETLFLSGFLFFTFIRALNPEIFWGEKPMDSTLLQFFTRNESLPPEDPWSAGTAMRYYYLGSYFFASLLKLTQIPPSIGYNLAIAILPAFCLTSFYSIFIVLTRNIKLALIGALLVIMGSNIEIINLSLIQFKKINFDTFWAATRLFTPPGFTEYPLWSFLFADLHAHVISVAVASLTLALSIGLMSSSRKNLKAQFWTHRAIYGLVWGSLVALNTWDFLIYSLVTFTFICARPTWNNEKSLSKNVLFKLKSIISENFVIGTVACLSMAPYLLSTKPETAASWGWNQSFEFNTLSQILRHFGIWIVGFIFAFLLILKRYGKSIGSIQSIPLTFSIIFSIFPIALGIACDYQGIRPVPWGILILSFALIQTAFLGLLLRGKESLTIRFCTCCILIAAFILALDEVFYLIDRMNSVFKFYCSIWFLFAAGSAGLVTHMVLAFEKSDKTVLRKCVWSYTANFLLIAVITACSVGTILNCFITATFHRVSEGPRPTLNGSLYLEQENPAEFELINWLNTYIIGNAHILEAQGDSYREFTRIAMHTGLTAVLGWDHHVKQRGTPESVVLKRKADITKMYSSNDVAQTELLLQHYKVNLIVVGKVERNTYSAEGLSKFDQHPELFPVLFRSGNTVLYTRTAALKSAAAEGTLQIKWNADS